MMNPHFLGSDPQLSQPVKRPSPSPEPGDHAAKKTRSHFHLDETLDTFPQGNDLFPCNQELNVHDNYDFRSDHESLDDLGAGYAIQAQGESLSLADPWPGTFENSIAYDMGVSCAYNQFVPGANPTQEYVGWVPIRSAPTPDLPCEEVDMSMDIDKLEQPEDEFLQRPQKLDSESSPETPVTVPSPIYFGTSVDYDTCFGVLVATPRSSFAPKGRKSALSVNVKSLGGIWMLHDQDTGQSVGVLGDINLINALKKISLRLDAMLLVSQVSDARGANKPKAKKVTKVTTKLKYSLRIAMYGMGIEKATIGSTLSNAGLFLQHPFADEIIQGTMYDNPHYLTRPGKGMPELENMSEKWPDLESQGPDSTDEISQNRFIQIFESAMEDFGVRTVTPTKVSPRLRSSLMSHQHTALAMMQERERGLTDDPLFPALWTKEHDKSNGSIQYRHSVVRGYVERVPRLNSGGVLADDMGLGKTLSILALICSSLDAEEQGNGPRGTLIVAPKSTIHNWSDQIKCHVLEKQMKSHLYHGSNRAGLSQTIEHVDVVITTYETIRSEWAGAKQSTPIYSRKWRRVVLDEAHHIRNRASMTFQAVCSIDSQSRWCLSGTPIHNSLDDYGALLSFLRVFPFEQKSKYTHLITVPVEEKDEHAVDRLRRLIRTTCLRRTKHKVLASSDTKLPPRSTIIQEVRLNRAEQGIYNIIKDVVVKKSRGLENVRGKARSAKAEGKSILALITWLRLLCNHNELLPSAIKQGLTKRPESFLNSGFQQFDMLKCSVCEGEVQGFHDRGSNQGQLCTNCASSEHEMEEDISGSINSDATGPPTVSFQPSAKIQAVLDNIKKEQERAANLGESPRKCVIFSYWVKMLDLMEPILRENRLGLQRIDGQTSLEGRRRALEQFNEDPDCVIMLASIGSTAEGVNLTSASIVHLMEPQWNPMVETQAVDRVYRIGQKREVEIIRYIVPDSVEVYVRQVQESKIQLANQTFSGEGDETQADLDKKRWKMMCDILDK